MTDRIPEYPSIREFKRSLEPLNHGPYRESDRIIKTARTITAKYQGSGGKDKMMALLHKPMTTGTPALVLNTAGLSQKLIKTEINEWDPDVVTISCDPEDIFVTNPKARAELIRTLKDRGNGNVILSIPKNYENDFDVVLDIIKTLIKDFYTEGLEVLGLTIPKRSSQEIRGKILELCERYGLIPMPKVGPNSFSENDYNLDELILLTKAKRLEVGQFDNKPYGLRLSEENTTDEPRSATSAGALLVTVPYHRFY